MFFNPYQAFPWQYGYRPAPSSFWNPWGYYAGTYGRQQTPPQQPGPQYNAGFNYGRQQTPQQPGPQYNAGSYYGRQQTPQQPGQPYYAQPYQGMQQSGTGSYPLIFGGTQTGMPAAWQQRGTQAGMPAGWQQQGNIPQGNMQQGRPVAGPSGVINEKKTPEKRKQELKADQFTASDLDQETLDQIISKYGVEIDDIYHLSPGQKWMFGRAHNVTNAFFLQMVFKVTMDLKPAAFRQNLDEVSLKRPNLRTAFAYRNLPEPYQVVLKNRRPELRFIDRSDKTMEELQEELEEFRISDRRRGFDLENDPLLRITIFSTAEKNTYAIVTSQPHINDDGASEMLIFKEVFVDYALGDKFPIPDIGAGSYKTYAEWLEGLDKEGEYKYWEELLSDAPKTHLPGRVRSSMEPLMNTQVLSFSKEEQKGIAALQARYGATLNSIAQTAWAVMLQKIYHTGDVIFGTITSGRSSEVEGSNQMTGGFVNAFPVRVRTEEGETFADLTKRVQLQILRSQEKAHFSPDELEEKMGRDTAFFDHLLNFHNFSGMSQQKSMPALPGFTVLGMENFDNLSTGFCLYFQMKEGKLQCLFTYDSHVFTERKIRLLMDCYRQVFLEVTGDEDKSLLVEQMSCPDISSFLSEGLDELEEREEIGSFLKQLSLFENVSEEDLLFLANAAQIRIFAENDEILGEGSVPKGLDLVMNGFVESFRTARNGWASPLMILKKGKLLSAAGVLTREPSYIGARAASEEVRILHIPKETMWQFFEKNPLAALNLVREQEETAKRFSYVWINADV